MNKGFMWVMSAVMGVLLLIIFLILGIAIGAGSTRTLSLNPDTMSAWVSALATVCIAMLTIILARETWRLRDIQTKQIDELGKNAIKPSISIHIDSSIASLNLINIIVKNNGRGTAQNIRFEFKDNSVDAKDVFEAVQTRINKLEILRTGILSLAPDERRRSHLLHFADLGSEFSDRAFDFISEVGIYFEDIEGNKYTSSGFISFSEFKGVSELGDTDPLYSLSQSIEKIQKTLEKFSGHSKLKIDMFDTQDRKNEDKRIRKIRKETQKKQSNENHKIKNFCRWLERIRHTK